MLNLSRLLLPTERLVLEKGIFDKFQAGVGILPGEPNLERADPRLEPGVRYIPRLKISESAGRRKTNDASIPGSELSVLKVFDPLPDGLMPQAEVLMSRVFPGVNPIC